MVVVIPPTLGYTGARDRQDGDGQRQVDEERPPPREMLDEPPTEHRAKCRGDRGEAGPGADRPAAILAVGKRGGDQGKAARNEERSTNAFRPSSDNELPDGRR